MKGSEASVVSNSRGVLSDPSRRRKVCRTVRGLSGLEASGPGDFARSWGLAGSYVRLFFFFLGGGGGGFET